MLHELQLARISSTVTPKSQPSRRCKVQGSTPKFRGKRLISSFILVPNPLSRNTQMLFEAMFSFFHFCNKNADARRGARGRSLFSKKGPTRALFQRTEKSRRAQRGLGIYPKKCCKTTNANVKRTSSVSKLALERGQSFATVTPSKPLKHSTTY